MGQRYNVGRSGLDRRTMLKGLGSVGAAVAIGTGTLEQVSGASAANPGQNIHLSLAAYSVRKALTSGKMDLFGFIDWCAELGLPGTELTSYYFEEGFDGAYLRRLRNRAFKQGVTISGTAVRNNFCQAPGPEKDKEIQHVLKWIDYAAELFAPHIRIFAGNVPDGIDKSTAIGWTADGVKAVLDHAAERGIFIGLENHGGITTMAEDLLAICKEVGEHPWFGVNLDTGNYRKDPYEELRMTAPLAVNVQIKVEISNEAGDKEPTDLERVRDIIFDSGYKGWVALEYEAEKDPFVAVPQYLAQMKKLFA